MQQIALAAVPAQNLNSVIGGQACQINLYSLTTPGNFISGTPILDSSGYPIYDSSGNVIYSSPSPFEALGYPALFADVTVGTTPIVTCRVVRNQVPWMLSSKYLGFVGDLVMVDQLSDTQPVWTGLGSQYQLVYLEASDLP